MARFAQRSKQELHVQAGGLDAAKTVLAPGSGRSLFLLTSPLIGHSENRTLRTWPRDFAVNYANAVTSDHPSVR